MSEFYCELHQADSILTLDSSPLLSEHSECEAVRHAIPPGGFLLIKTPDQAPRRLLQWLAAAFEPAAQLAEAEFVERSATRIT
jgi:hypothetical protein